MPRIFAWASDTTGCGWYRIELPCAELNRRGGDATWSTEMPMWVPTDADVVIGQRVALPEASRVWQQLCRLGRSRMVLELDDDLWNIPPSNVKAHKAFTPVLLENLRRNIEMSDVVTVTTDALAEVVAEHNPNVVVIPNRIPAWLLEHQRPQRDDFTIGWAGSPSHAIDWDDAGPQVGRFLKRNPRVKVHLMGASFHSMLSWPRERIQLDRWIDSVEDYYRALDFDIGLAPLRPHVFNSSKCVDLGMRVCTDRGVYKAGDLTVGTRVWRDGWRRIQAVEHGPARPGFLITLGGGYQLRLTPEHRMLRGDEWVRADELAVGDWLPMEAESVGPTRYIRAPWPSDGRLSGDRWKEDGLDPKAFLAAKDGPKVDITPRWGRLLGAFVGDGSVGQATQINITCDGQDQDWIDLLMDDFRACGFNPRTEKVKTFDGTVIRRRAVRIASAHLLRVLESWGLTRPRESGTPIRVSCVPEIIWRSPKDVIAEFIAGYFEADGHCSGAGVQATSKDEQLIRDMQRLLLLFGITSKVTSRMHSAQNGYISLYWHCTLRRSEADVFAKEIGFRSERKQAKLTEIVSKPHSNAYRPMEWSREIVAIETCAVDPVDIQVEGESFVLAGFVSHNSAIKTLELAALGIPTVASANGPYEGSVEHGKTGLLVHRDHEWSAHLRTLTEDEGARAEMGRNARELAAEQTVEGNLDDWTEAWQMGPAPMPVNHSMSLDHGVVLTAEKVREIRAAYAQSGRTYQSLADEYGVSIGNVCHIIKRTPWQNV